MPSFYLLFNWPSGITATWNTAMRGCRQGLRQVTWRVPRVLIRLLLMAGACSLCSSSHFCFSIFWELLPGCSEPGHCWESLQGRLYRRAHKRQLQTTEYTVGLGNIGGDMKGGMVPSTAGSNYPSKSEAFIQPSFLMEDALGSLQMMGLGDTTACS